MKKLSYIFFFAAILIGAIGCVKAYNASVSEPAISTTTTATTTTTTERTAPAQPATNNGVPYDGMAESKIRYTSLGEPTSVDLCKDFYKLQPRHRIKYYVWKKNGTTIFRVTVLYWDHKNNKAVDGYVSYVCDWRNTTTTKYHYTTKKYTTTKDPYNVNSYGNEDDFYYDHYDDFIDYYEAEDYYNENHD